MKWKKFLLLSPLFLFTGCAPRTVLLTRSRLLMGHVPVNVSIQTTTEKQSEALQASEGAYQLASQIESGISEYQPNSEISCLNKMAGKGFCPVSATTFELLNTSLALARQTDHAFDIRFASKTLEGVRGKITLRQDPPKASLDSSRTRIGVGAIGKGFIVDKMLDYLRSKGFDRVLIDAGGDLRALGGPWKVAIQSPTGEPGKFSKTMEINNRALATSGLYEQGQHIVDPRTLNKVEGGGSVTVEAENLTLADALATAFFVMGEKESLFYLKKFPDVKIFWTDPEGMVLPYP